MSESQLLADILLAHSRGNVRLWRQNSGIAWQGKIVSQDHNRLVLSPYYAIKLAPEGTSDLGGLVSEVVTPEMVGRPIAVYAGIEGKTKTGRVSAVQQSFIEMVCEWVAAPVSPARSKTRAAYSMNNGRSRELTLDGRTQSLKAWAREFNIPVNTVRTRLERGYDLRVALTALRAGLGYRGPRGRYGIISEWREWVSAPVLTVK